MSVPDKAASTPPLPVREGVAPSRVFLPKGPWLLLRDFLVQRFPYMPAQVLLDRLARGEIVDGDGTAQHFDSPYMPLHWLWYYREVLAEVSIPFDLPVLYRDDCLVVVDKPHFLASIPGGRHLKETALTRLRQSLDLPLLSPLHRLDRDTAGVLMFCIDPQHRGAYQSLFQQRAVQKEYEAIAPIRPDLSLPMVYRSRLQAKVDEFVVEEIEGEPNSETLIDLAEHRSALGLYRLYPHTGRKHQLRVHMSALGIPICNDGFYPVLREYAQADDFSRPLQLLSRAIEFKDPYTGSMRRFESQRSLDWDKAG
ncbi:pseudouridine synthase [Pusillimonas sp. ANT_WB101]|uniref:pseudouridine synthase n=1 Tax=Pusillimonas sp. ANT_WB101 TaxID=2597356 RepID=UPI0011F02F98|nr:pseudouridine synthase [Pusillimonas sp. ANT_WB101]KAA0890748.1 pseudouridine synthase [Pusillimonas sp. ANT_WB101]